MSGIDLCGRQMSFLPGHWNNPLHIWHSRQTSDTIRLPITKAQKAIDWETWPTVSGLFKSTDKFGKPYVNGGINGHKLSIHQYLHSANHSTIVYFGHFIISQYGLPRHVLEFEFSDDGKLPQSITFCAASICFVISCACAIESVVSTLTEIEKSIIRFKAVRPQKKQWFILIHSFRSVDTDRCLCLFESFAHQTRVQK